MRMFFVLLFFAAGMAVIICSCGKDHDSPSTPSQDNPLDSIPADWVKAKTPTDTTHLIDIFFQNNTTGYAVGEAGEVWKSADGGMSWSSVFQVPGKQGCYNMAVTADGKVYIVLDAAGSGIYYSSDGITFQYMRVGSIDNEADVYFINNDTGYISGASGMINNTLVHGFWQTTDGGNHWQLTEIAGTKFSPRSHDFSFYNAAYGYMLNDGGVSSTRGQYNQWSAPVFLSYSLCTLSAAAERTAYAADFKGIIYKTTDGGASFTKTDSLRLTTSTSYVNLHFVNEQTGYATTANVLYKTTDGAATWLPVLTSQNALDEVHFTDASHGWVCGNKGTILVYRP